MNRKKKLISTMKKKAKKANDKLKHNNKPQYIAKALRDKELSTNGASELSTNPETLEK